MPCRCLQSFDIFKRPIYLHFNSREKNASRLGFLFSLGIYVLIIIEFLKSDIFFYESPTIINQPTSEASRRTLNFSNKVFTVSIVDDHSLAFADPSIFKILAKNVYMSSKDGAYDFDEIIYKPLHLCTEEDFPSDPTVFYDLGLNNSYCLDDNNFLLSGYWDESYVVYFSLEVYICNGSDPDIICKSPEEIKDFFTKKYFNLVFSSLKVDDENYTHPIYLKNLNEYKLMDLRLNKMMNIFLKEIEVTTDDGLIFSSTWDVNDIDFDYSEVDFSFQQSEINISNPIFTCDFYSSKNVQKISRTYEKISNIFSNIGGLLSFLMIWGFLLTYLENTLSLTVQIMKGLYSFQPPATKDQQSSPDKPLMTTDSPPHKFILDNPPKLFSQEHLPDKNLLEEQKQDPALYEKTNPQNLEKQNPLQGSTISLEIAFRSQPSGLIKGLPMPMREEPSGLLKGLPMPVREEAPIEEKNSPEKKKKN